MMYPKKLGGVIMYLSPAMAPKEFKLEGGNEEAWNKLIQPANKHMDVLYMDAEKDFYIKPCVVEMSLRTLKEMGWNVEEKKVPGMHMKKPTIPAEEFMTTWLKSRIKEPTFPTENFISTWFNLR